MTTEMACASRSVAGGGRGPGEHRRLARLLLLVPLLLGTSPVFASAPLDQYENFLPSTPEIQDRRTKLLWDRDATPALTYSQAAAVCSAKGKRLPTVKELATLVDEVGHDEFVIDAVIRLYIDEKAFRATPPGPFWTFQGTGKALFVIDFTNGEIRESLSGAKFVRCVV